MKSGGPHAPSRAVTGPAGRTSAPLRTERSPCASQDASSWFRTATAGARITDCSRGARTLRANRRMGKGVKVVPLIGPGIYGRFASLATFRAADATAPLQLRSTSPCPPRSRAGRAHGQTFRSGGGTWAAPSKASLGHSTPSQTWPERKWATATLGGGKGRSWWGSRDPFGRASPRSSPRQGLQPTRVARWVTMNGKRRDDRDQLGGGIGLLWGPVMITNTHSSEWCGTR